MHSTDDPSQHIVPITGDAHVVRQADTDAQLIDLWLHGRSDCTQRAYRSDIQQFLYAVSKPLIAITLLDSVKVLKFL